MWPREALQGSETKTRESGRNRRENCLPDEGARYDSFASPLYLTGCALPVMAYYSSPWLWTRLEICLGLLSMPSLICMPSIITHKARSSNRFVMNTSSLHKRVYSSPENNRSHLPEGIAKISTRKVAHLYHVFYGVGGREKRQGWRCFQMIL